MTAVQLDPKQQFREITVAKSRARRTATHTAAVVPTMGLFPMLMSPSISTYAGTDQEPENERRNAYGLWCRSN
jgi:hypothetical protein